MLLLLLLLRSVLAFTVMMELYKCTRACVNVFASVFRLFDFYYFYNGKRRRRIMHSYIVHTCTRKIINKRETVPTTTRLRGGLDFLLQS